MRIKTSVHILVLLLLCAVVALYVRSITKPMGFGDSHRYLAIAQSPGKLVYPPQGFRIAIPYTAALLSKILHLDLKTVFTAIQISLYSLILSVLYLWSSRGFRFSRITSLLVCILFVFSYPGIYHLHNTVHVGLAEHLFILLGCMAIYHKRFIALVSILAVSAFVKESIGFILIPVFFICSLSGDSLRAFMKTAVLIALYVPLFFFVRSGLLFGGDSDFSAYSSFYSMEVFRHVTDYWGGFRGALREITYTFGPVWILALAGWYFSSNRLKMLAVLPLLAILQIFLAADINRMVGIGFPVLLAFSGNLLQRMEGTQAVFLTGISCLYFLCWNSGEGIINLAGTVLLTLILLYRVLPDILRKQRESAGVFPK